MYLILDKVNTFWKKKIEEQIFRFEDTEMIINFENKINLSNVLWRFYWMEILYSVFIRWVLENIIR